MRASPRIESHRIRSASQAEWTPADRFHPPTHRPAALPPELELRVETDGPHVRPDPVLEEYRRCL